MPHGSVPPGPGSGGSGGAGGRGGIDARPGGTGGTRDPADAGGGGSGGSTAAGGSGSPPADATAPVDRSAPPADAGGPDTAPSSDAGAADSMSAPVGPPGPWARGVSLGLVEAAQAVFVRLGNGDTVVPPAMRNAEVIEGRFIFVRAHLQTEAGFMARPLRAVFTLAYDDGSKHEVEDSKMVSGVSNAEQLASTFNGLFPAEAVKPGGTLSVAVYEAAGNAGGMEPARPPRFPATGGVDLGIKAGRMVLDAVMVPAIGPGGMVDDSPARRKNIEDHLFDVYPVQKVNVRWRQPVRFTSRIGSSQGFSALREARTQDGAKPYEYYHLIVAVEDSTESYLGIANSAGASVNDGARRIAITFVRKRQADSSVDTISHEMGHNHGRNHPSGCGSDGYDTNYPYPNTGVGVNGFVHSTKRLTPARTFKDLMGYCYPTHLSDYTWNGFARRVRAVSAFPRTDTQAAFAARSLQGFQEPGQPIRWGPVPGPLVADGARPTAGRQARITLDDGRTSTAPVAVQVLSDGRTRELAVDLPADGELARVDLTIDGARFRVTAAELAATARGP